MEQQEEQDFRSRHKLYRPTVASDYVERGDWENDLSRPGAPPIVVVAAPAGYGKSSVASRWVERIGHPCVWVSLDVQDNDLHIVLEYLAVGLADHCPVAAEHLLHYCQAPELPPAKLIASRLSADFQDFAKPIAVVLDDYHTIHDQQIHELVDSLLQLMPPTLQIAIVGRSTPPLTLGRLRSRGLVADVRLTDLRLDKENQRVLVEAITGMTLGPDQLDKLHSITDGWPVGLRLLLHARPVDSDISSHLESFDGNIWQIQDYLTQEVLNALAEPIWELLLRTSILKQFSPELCDALLGESNAAGPSGREAVDTILEKQLFCIPLSRDGQWFRYHRQFQDLLLNCLNDRFSREEIRSFHRRAAAWYDANDFPEDAIYHCLQENDESRAGEVIIRRGAMLQESQQWSRLGRLLAMLSKETIHDNVDLLMLLVWTSDKAGRVEHAIELTELAEEVLSHAEANEQSRINHGQISAARCLAELHLGTTEAALKFARHALDVLPQTFSYERGLATFGEGYALQTLGRGSEGMTILRIALQNAANDKEAARILYGMCFLHWANADLAGLDRDSRSLRSLGKDSKLRETFMWASWWGGAAMYLKNNLDAAESVVLEVAEDLWPIDFIAHASCVHIQALVHAARGDTEAAQQLAFKLAEKCISARGTTYLPDVQALQAELAFAVGDVAPAVKWALNESFEVPFLGYGLIAPGLIAARILVASDSTKALQKADNLLRVYQEFYESTHNTRYLIETLALRALYQSRTGEDDAALSAMSRALDLAQPSGLLRLFIDLGPDIVPLLNRLDVQKNRLRFVGTILADVDPGKAVGLPELLSQREQEVLELLGNRLSNKEIGERLFISPATVKRHTHSIYEKLNVSDRHEAVAKAAGLGLLAQ